MSVMIKGLEMPETEYMDVRIFRDGTAAIATGAKPYYRELKAVEVPTPHGRLIDADALDEKVEKHRKMLKISRYDRDLVLHYTDVEMASTVIEAEE